MKYWGNLFAALLIFLHAPAQDIDWQHYQPLQCTGRIPDDFTQLSSRKYETEKKEIDVNAKRGVQKSQDQFFLKSNFIMNEVLHSGRVIFGDPVSQYLNNIKDNLLSDDPQLRDKIRIYTFRSTEANAYTSNDGVVLVTTGLIAQAENEAQLAFILCHEFQHYIRKHALNEYVESREMLRGRGIYRNLDPNEIELKAFQYSKDLESQADSLGLELFKNSNYSTEAGQRVFDVLLYSYLPFDEVKFSKDYFNEGSYKIPAEYFLDSVSAISAVDDYDDSKNTHPNIKSRRAAIINELKESLTADKKGDKLFVQPEEAFKNIQKICRYENCVLHLNNCEFEETFYNAYLLMQNDPANIFLKKIMTRALYGESFYKNYNHSIDNSIYYRDVEGESQQVYYLFDKMPKKDFNVLALKFAWNTHIADEGNETISRICQGLADQLVNGFNLTSNDFKDAYPVVVIDTVKKSEQDSIKSSEKTLSKVDKIKASEAANNTNDHTYWRYAFVDYRSDSSFNQLFADAEKVKKENTANEKTKRKKHTEYALGIDQAVIVNPIYLKVDETRKDPIRYVAAEQLKLDLQDKIQACADALDMQINYLETMNLNNNDADKFNDLALLNNWISEELNHDNVPVINSNNEMMRQLVSKYHTEYFTWVGVISFKERKEYVGGRIFLGVLFFPYLPFALAYAVKPNYDTAIFTLVANGKSGEFEMQYSNAVDARDLASIQKSNLYYIMQQMKAKPGVK